MLLTSALYSSSSSDNTTMHSLRITSNQLVDLLNSLGVLSRIEILKPEKVSNGRGSEFEYCDSRTGEGESSVAGEED